MKVKSEREVAESCPTPSDPLDCSLPGSSVHGIFQARVLEWGAIAFSKNYVYMNTNKGPIYYSFGLICFIPYKKREIQPILIHEFEFLH